jgi:hypothetical protein
MINKKTLSEISIYSGKIKMPEGFEIKKETLVKDISISNYYEDVKHPFSIEWDKLKNFITDFTLVEHKLSLIPKNTSGKYYERNEVSKPIVSVNPVDLKNSPDFILLYGVEIDPETCEVVIYYDDNRRKGRSYNFNLETNSFIMFPSSQLYYIKNNKNSFLNYIQTISFDFI